MAVTTKREPNKTYKLHPQPIISGDMHWRREFSYACDYILQLDYRPWPNCVDPNIPPRVYVKTRATKVWILNPDLNWHYQNLEEHCVGAKFYDNYENYLVLMFGNSQNGPFKIVTYKFDTYTQEAYIYTSQRTGEEKRKDGLFLEPLHMRNDIAEASIFIDMDYVDILARMSNCTCCGDSIKFLMLNDMATLNSCSCVTFTGTRNRGDYIYVIPVVGISGYLFIGMTKDGLIKLVELYNRYGSLIRSHEASVARQIKDRISVFDDFSDVIMEEKVSSYLVRSHAHNKSITIKY